MTKHHGDSQERNKPRYIRRSGADPLSARLLRYCGDELHRQSPWASQQAGLRRLQLDRGFVPSKNTQAKEESETVQEVAVREMEEPNPEFVPSFCLEPLAEFEEDLPPFVLEDLRGRSYNPLTCDQAV